MNARELLEIHKHYLDCYLHDHRLSWELIGIGWATNVGILSAFVFAFSLKGQFSLHLALCIIGLLTNIVWWIALERNEVYKNSYAFEGIAVEKNLEQLGFRIYVFRTREKIREGKWYPAKQRKLLPWEALPSTFAPRYSFLFLATSWAILSLILL